MTTVVKINYIRYITLCHIPNDESVLLHPPITSSSDIFALFKTLKAELGGEKFTSREKLVAHVNEIFWGISRFGTFEEILIQWVARHEICITRIHPA